MHKQSGDVYLHTEHHRASFLFQYGQAYATARLVGGERVPTIKQSPSACIERDVGLTCCAVFAHRRRTVAHPVHGAFLKGGGQHMLNWARASCPPFFLDALGAPEGEGRGLRRLMERTVDFLVLAVFAIAVVYYTTIILIIIELYSS